MKKIFRIKTFNKNYKIIVEYNSIISYILKEAQNKQKIFILIDNKIKYLLKDKILPKNIKLIKIKGGEKIKSIDNYAKILTQLLNLKIDRNSTIIAIGGGTIGDLSGFIASTILRGINFILIPTTLLSQVDSSIGGKNGINTVSGKNLIGTFYQPDKVIIDPSILLTLPKREIKSGYAEIVKHALIHNKSFYLWLDKNYKKVINIERNYIIKAITKSIEIKSYFVENDEKEKLINSSSRAMLNFGHTFGHALEAMNNYNNKLSHGEAVSIGIAMALKISYKLDNINIKEYLNVINHLKKVKLPYDDRRVKENKIYKIMLSDKKNSNNKINLILLKKIGSAYFKRELETRIIKELLN